MAVKIRLRRVGGNNDASYRVVATDGRSPRDGRFLEILGWYDPKKKASISRSTRNGSGIGHRAARWSATRWPAW